MNIERKIRRNAARKQQQMFTNADSDWLDDADFKPCNCSLCGAEIHHVHQSNNPYPLGQEGDKCCHVCNVTQVIPARLGLSPDETEDLVRDLLPQVLERLREQEARLTMQRNARTHAA